MASQQSKWREELVLVICPGSQTTLAQLGCNELTPPAHRFPTRVFRDPSGHGYRPYHTFRRKKPTAANRPPDAAGNRATATAAAAAAAAMATSAEAVGAAAGGGDAKPALRNDGEDEDVEDPDSLEGAIYPLQGEL